MRFLSHKFLSCLFLFVGSVVLTNFANACTEAGKRMREDGEGRSSQPPKTLKKENANILITDILPFCTLPRSNKELPGQEEEAVEQRKNEERASLLRKASQVVKGKKADYPNPSEQGIFEAIIEMGEELTADSLYEVDDMLAVKIRHFARRNFNFKDGDEFLIPLFYGIAANLGNPKAMVLLAELYEEEKYGMPDDDKVARHLREAAAEKGYYEGREFGRVNAHEDTEESSDSDATVD